MRIVTYNVNGIRAAMRRGFRDWLDGCGADVVALQEVRCRVADLPPDAFGDYHVVYNPGQLAGRNGVAILSRLPVATVFTWADAALVTPVDQDAAPLLFGGPRLDVIEPTGDGNPFATEGRLVGVELAEAPLDIVCVYVPKGGVPIEVAPKDGGREGYTPQQQQARYERKVAFLERFAAEIDAWHAAAEARGRHLLVLGDYNIAHGPADLKNWRGNLDHEGFLPAERAWLDVVAGQASSSSQLIGKKILAPSVEWTPPKRPLVDVVRALHPDVEGPYSWWSRMGQAYANDVGWRIDYHLASPGLAAKAAKAWVDRAPDADSRVSDHAPVVVDYDL